MQITGTSRFPYLLYVLDVSGVAYLLRIRNVSAYAFCSIIPVDEVLELNLHDYFPNPNQVTITAVTATVRCLIIGTSDGSVFCFQLGVLDPSAPGMVNLALSSLVSTLCATAHVACFLLPAFAFILNVIYMFLGNLSLQSYCPPRLV